MSSRLRTFALANLAIFAIGYPLILLWLWIGGPEISMHGWIAASGGIALTWILGVALMGLLFASGDGDDSRSGP